MSAANANQPPPGSSQTPSPSVATGVTGTGATVSGVPFVPVYAPPVAHTYGQQYQFPPPLPPANYMQYGSPGLMYKPAYTQFPPPPPPSLFNSRYPTPSYYPTPVQQQHLYPGPSVAQAPHRPRDDFPLGYNDGEVYTLEFSQASTRTEFVKRVLTLLLIQITIATILSGICLEQEYVHDKIVDRNSWVVGMALLAMLGVVTYSKMRVDFERNRMQETTLFVIWSFGMVFALSWITSLLNLEFLFIVQCLVSVALAALLFASVLMRESLLMGKSIFLSVSAMMVTAILLGALYVRAAAPVFFAIFASSILMLFFLFRLHFLMGDERKNLQSTEGLTGAMHIFF